MDILPQDFYLRDTALVARELLGKELVHIVNGAELAAVITETEAYTGVNDRACHAYGGRRTARTEVMYKAGGRAYIYLIYGMYHLLNFVTEKEGNPCAVLIRAARPVSGIEAIARNRFGKSCAELSKTQYNKLLDGPGKVCKGLGLGMAQNGMDLFGPELFVRESSVPKKFETGVGKRINIDYAGEDKELPLRFYQIVK